MSIITIIDTGISEKYANSHLKDRILGKYVLNENSMTLEMDGDSEDELGHGTMICSAINMINKHARFNFIKAFGKNSWVDENMLIAILNEIYRLHIETDIIHISFGIQVVERIGELETILNKLNKLGIIIVAAYANNQVLSYPAVCNSVIGVAFDTSIVSVNHWIYVENSPINIFACGQMKNFINNAGKSVKSAGSSFAAAFISGHISKYMDTQENTIDVETFLKQNSTRVYEAPTITSNECFEMKRIVIFPFNKENHSIVRNSKMLRVELHSILDTKYSPYIGKNAFELLSISDYEYVDEDEDRAICLVEDLMQFDWRTNFDTFVLGHIGYLESVYPFSLFDYIINKCIESQKNLYTYDNISNEAISKMLNAGLSVYCPKKQYSNVEKNHCGLLYEIGKPVVGIFGTSSRQGKWSLQLKLREIMESRGYRTGHLGTEPNALLFKNTMMSATGYNSEFDLSHAEAISLFNYQLHEVESWSDIIFFGTQSNVIPNAFGGLPTIPIYTYEMICGCEPQASILCINEWDDIQYIKRCISYLESYHENKVIALAYFFKDYHEIWDSAGVAIQELKYDYDTISSIKNEIGIPIFNMSIKDEMELLCDEIINYF